MRYRKEGKMGYNIAIDGPAGAGKSTVAKMVAEKKGYIYVDTGALYRGLAVHFIRNGIREEETDKMIRACESADISIVYESGVQQVYLNKENITAMLRREDVGKMTSVSSAIPQIRKKLLNLQRQLARTKDVVMDGRDIGTAVLPEADVKIYLTANVKTRAMRRYQELKGKGIACILEEIEQDIRERDERDMNREVSPLKQAEDAVYLDSSDMTTEQVVAEILKLSLCAKEKIWK